MTVFHRYVNADTGDNGNGGESAGDAWATISYAISQTTTTLGDIWVLHLKGTFDHTSTQITAGARNGSPLVFTVDAAGDATITVSPTSTPNLFSSTPGYLVLDGIIFENVWWNTINIGQYCYVVNCTFRGRPSANGNSSYSLNMAGGNVHRCRFEGVGIGAAGLCISDCDFMRLTGSAGTTGIYTGHNSQISRCRFVENGIIGGNTYGATIRNCSFVNCASGISIAAFSMNLVAENNVFQNCNTVFGAVGRYYRLANNYSFGHTTAGPAVADGVTSAGLTSLVAAPYTDPANGDWTPTAELAGYAGADNITPGASQSAGGGGNIIVIED